MDEIIKYFAAKADNIYDNRTAGDFTWHGFLTDFLFEVRTAYARDIAGLLSDDGENAEYDRACVEIARDLMNIHPDTGRGDVEAWLRKMKSGEL